MQKVNIGPKVSPLGQYRRVLEAESSPHGKPPPVPGSRVTHTRTYICCIKLCGMGRSGSSRSSCQKSISLTGPMCLHGVQSCSVRFVLSYTDRDRAPWEGQRRRSAKRHGQAALGLLSHRENQYDTGKSDGGSKLEYPFSSPIIEYSRAGETTRDNARVGNGRSLASVHYRRLCTPLARRRHRRQR